MNINVTFLFTMIIILTGFAAKKIGIINEDHGKAASRIIINLTLPALLFNTISRINISFSLAVLPVLCFVISMVVLAFAFFLFRNHSKSEKGIGLLCSISFNVGLFAFPIMEGLFGRKGLEMAAMFDLGNAFVLFVVAYFIGYYYSPIRSDKKITVEDSLKLFGKSVPFITYFIAIIVNLSGIIVPENVYKVLEIPARANMGMSLLVIGILLNFKFDKSQWSVILKSIFVRYAVGIVIAVPLFLFLPFSLEYRTVLFMCILLPVAMAVIPFSVEFDYDASVSGTIANFTIIISFFIMWGFMLYLNAYSM